MAQAETRVKPFGALADGRPVDEITLVASSVEIRVITYGAILTAVRVPDRWGKSDDIVLGHDSLESYVLHSPYFGAVVGRYGNRIAGARFSIDGRSYSLSQNDGSNCLHGGMAGFDKAVWTIADASEKSVRLTHVSADGDQGFPGTMVAAVTYTLTGHGELLVEYEAVADAATVVNLTQHSYWNLAGAGYRDILDHELTLRASRFTPTDAHMIPTGELRAVSGTPFDFRTPATIGSRIHEMDEQLRNGHGYDHNFVLDAEASASEAALLREAVSGRSLRVTTTEPGVQLYTGNRLDGTITGKRGVRYGAHAGVCLETQHFPDSPNRPQFPSTLLMADERYSSRTVFSFGAD
jgi:Galactose mutarotase and related enzymes